MTTSLKIKKKERKGKAQIKDVVETNSEAHFPSHI